LLAIIPSLMVADGRIALASIVTFFLIQQLDVVIFHALKERFATLWWLRNNGSTITSQFFDTALFFTLAFGGTMPTSMLIKLIVGDYTIKIILALLDTPLFYLFAIKLQNRNTNQV
ncbi:MAG: queuosine precursor transporter, partial [Campylobacteraceae bacterium]|nr:queuosine precursor transporter [Campylobacteraceae bacterium]